MVCQGAEPLVPTILTIIHTVSTFEIPFDTLLLLLLLLLFSFFTVL